MSGALTDRRAAAQAIHGLTQPRDLLPAAIRHALTPLWVGLPDGCLDDLTVDGYALGARFGQGAVAGNKADDLGSIDWSEWTPGDVETARKLLAGATNDEVLRTLLQDADVTIKSISDNRLGALAEELAAAVADGDTVDELASAIGDFLDDPDRAGMVAQTELTRAMVAGSLDTYDSLGVLWIAFLSAEDATVCDLCNENEEQGAIPITDAFVNGMAPVHPRCRCTIVPAAGPGG